MKTRPADVILAVLLGLTLLAAGAGAVAGLGLVSEDLEMQGEMLDGLGILVGLAVVGLVAVPMALAATALVAIRRGRAGAWKWGTAAGVAGLVSGIPFGMFHHPLFALLVLPLLAAVVAVEGRERVS